MYDRYAAAAHSLAVRLVGASQATDVVHDAFVALLEKSSTFDPTRGSFRAWFMTSVHHRCLNLLRKAKPMRGEVLLAGLLDGGPDPAEAAVQRLRDESVRDALQRLPEDQRRLIVLAYYQGLSQGELAARFGLPLGTVKARMRRGLIALRNLIRGEAAEPAGRDEPTGREEPGT